MLRKRASSNETSQRAKKMPKLDDQEIKNNNVIKKRSMTKLEKLELALEQNNHNPQVLRLIREVVESSQLSTNLILRLLKFCIKVESETIVRQILSQQNIDLKTPKGGEILWEAVIAGNTTIATLLVRANANLSLRDCNRHTILDQVLTSLEIKDEAKKNQLIRLMLDYGADINVCDHNGYSLLFKAISYESCSSEQVEIFLQRGAKLFVTKSSYFNEFHHACNSKPELLLKLIDYQVPDEKTRNERCLLMIDELMLSEDKRALHFMKQILDLGILLDTIYEDIIYKHPVTLLHAALALKKIDVIKLLLDYGADPHQKDRTGCTALYQATGFKEVTHASRMIIERGASINDPNTDGCYPIHGACINNSEKNIHLFLSLGANLNVTDKEGCTPFQYTDPIFNFNNAHRLIIKHFALIIAKGGIICDKDLEIVELSDWGNHHFQKCKEQLKQMKMEYIFDKVSYFSLFTEDMFGMLKLIKNCNFIRNFKRDEKKRIDLFPDYSYMLLHSFEIAEKRYNLLLSKKKQLENVFRDIFPDIVIEKIVFYSCLEKLERCQYDYYMSFHDRLEPEDADRVHIL